MKWVSVQTCSILVVGNLFLALVTSTVTFRLYKSVLTALNKTQDKSHPFQVGSKGAKKTLFYIFFFIKTVMSPSRVHKLITVLCLIYFIQFLTFCLSEVPRRRRWASPRACPCPDRRLCQLLQWHHHETQEHLPRRELPGISQIRSRWLSPLCAMLSLPVEICFVVKLLLLTYNMAHKILDTFPLNENVCFDSFFSNVSGKFKWVKAAPKNSKVFTKEL